MVRAVSEMADECRWPSRVVGRRCLLDARAHMG